MKNENLGPTTEPYDVFISYAREDRDWVTRELYDRLLRCRTLDGRRPRVFLDAGAEGIGLGGDYTQAIPKAIENSRTIVPVYSRIYFQKKGVEWEMSMFIDHRLRTNAKLLPVLKDSDAENDVPLRVRTIQYQSASEPDWFPRLCRAIGLVPVTAQPVLEFVNQPPKEIPSRHTLPLLRVRVKTAAGQATTEEEITLSAEQGELQGAVKAKSEDGIATYADLLMSGVVSGTRLVATAKGCESAISERFDVIAPPVVQRSETSSAGEQIPLIPVQGEAIFFSDGEAIAVLTGDRVVVYDVKGTRRGDGLSVSGRVRMWQRSDSRIALADWSGNVYLLAEDGEAQQRSFYIGGNLMQIPGGLALTADGVYVGFWSGEVYRLAPGASPAKLLQHESGVQALGVVRNHIYVAGLDGKLTVYQDNQPPVVFPLETTVHLLKAYPDCIVAVGEERLHHLRIHTSRIFDQRLPLMGVVGVLGDVDRPVLIDGRGKGVRIDKELVYEVRFHTTAGARPISADHAGRYCIFLNPDGSRILMEGARVVFTCITGTLAVAPTGNKFALGGKSGIQIIDAPTFRDLIERGSRV